MELTLMSLGEMKKNALLEVFRDVVIGKACMGEDYIAAAVNKSRAVGISDQDIEWVVELAKDGEAFKKVFGKNALSLEFQALLKVCDNFAGDQPRFKGLYGELEQRYPRRRF